MVEDYKTMFPCVFLAIVLVHSSRLLLSLIEVCFVRVVNVTLVFR